MGSLLFLVPTASVLPPRWTVPLNCHTKEILPPVAFARVSCRGNGRSSWAKPPPSQLGEDGRDSPEKGAIRRKRGGGPENEIHCRVIVKKIKSSVHIYRKPMLMKLGVFWNFSAFSCGFGFFRGGGWGKPRLAKACLTTHETGAAHAQLTHLLSLGANYLETELTS